jgi:hypothetical protein
MVDRKLDIAFWNYDRTRALADGRVTIPGVEATFHVLVSRTMRTARSRLGQPQTFRDGVLSFMRTAPGCCNRMFLRFFRLGVLAFDVSARHVKRFVSETANFRSADHSGRDAIFVNTKAFLRTNLGARDDFWCECSSLWILVPPAYRMTLILVRSSAQGEDTTQHLTLADRARATILRW